MVTNLVGTTNVVAGGLALAVLLCWAPGSQAAVYTGSATDAANDLSLYAGDRLPDPPTSFTNVAVKYDDAVGRVDVSYTFDQAPPSYQEIHAGVGFGTTQADGSCSAPFFISLGWHVSAGEGRGESAVEGHSANFTGDVTGHVFNLDDQALWDSTSFFEWPGAQRTWNFATTNGALVGRHYNCATAGMWLMDNPAPADAGPGEDFLESNALALTPVAAANNPDPPLVDTPEPVPPTASSGTQPDKPAPRFSRQEARAALKKVLARRYGKVFRERKSYTVSCARTSASRWTCTVLWRYGQVLHEDSIKLTLRSDGRIGSRTLLRKTVK